MDEKERATLFGAWAKSYDAGLAQAEGFPFEGYERLLDAVVREVEPGRRVLDVGTGTGELAARLAAKGCGVVGIDFSPEMLLRARVKLPGAELIELELLGAWDVLEGRRFERIVSAYVFHEFEWATKVTLLQRLAALLEPGGVLLVGDIAFEDALARDAARRQWKSVWDDAEHYWAAAEDAPVLEAAGFGVRYTQVSFCAGVFVLEPPSL